LSNTAWAVAVLPFEHEPLLNAIAKEALEQITDFEHQDLANTAWAWAVLKLFDGPLLQAIAS